MKWYQQGDVIIDPLVNYNLEFPTDGKPVEPGQTGFVLAHGEHGHSHVLEAQDGVEVVEKPTKLKLHDGTTEDVRYFVRIKGNKKANLNHEEHRLHTYGAGEFVIRGVREYDHFAEEARKVVD